MRVERGLGSTVNEAVTREKSPKRSPSQSREEAARTSTRGFHDAMTEWRRSLPSMPPDYPTYTTFPGGVMDLDREMMGKRGVFFNHGTAMYSLYRSSKVHGRLKGHGKILHEHIGALFALLDDAQGMVYGGPALTKNLRLTFTAPFDLSAFTKTVNLEARADILTNGDRIDILSNVYVFDSSGKLLCLSNSHFVQNATIRKFQIPPELSDEEIAAQKDKVWESLRPYLLTPNLTWRDSGKYSFPVRFPFQTSSLPFPSFWKPLQGDHTNIKSIDEVDLLKGRLQFDHIAYSENVCRGVMKSGLSAEGPVAFVHGGCAASAWLFILSHAIDLKTLRVLTIHYKKPIDLEAVMACEWVRFGACEWRGTARDSRGDIFHEMVVECTAVASPANQPSINPRAAL